MNKIFAFLVALLLPLAALGQTLPSPSYNDVAVQRRLNLTGANTPISPLTVPWATRNGVWFAPTWNLNYYGLPDFGSTTPVYTQGLLKCSGTADVNTYQSCFGVEMYNNTGAAPPWTANTAYALGKFTQVNGNKVYKVTTAGTSGSTAPAWPSSGTVTDGTVVWTYQNEGQYNAKSGITASSTSTANGGNHWLFNPNCRIEAGFKSQLYCLEIDVGNHSGFDWTPGSSVPGPQAIWIGGETENTGAAAINVGSQNSIAGKPAWYFGFWCGNALAAGQGCFEDWSNSIAGYHSASFASKSYDLWLQSTSQIGLYLNGTYSTAQIQGNGFTIGTNGAVTSNAAITSNNGFLQANGNNGRVNLLTGNNRGWRMFNGSSGTSLGDLSFQGTTDNFSTSFVNGFTIGTDNTIRQTAIAISALPTCNSGNATKMAIVNNGISAPTYLQTVSTTGSSTRKVFCDGTAWLYD